MSCLSWITDRRPPPPRPLPPRPPPSRIAAPPPLPRPTECERWPTFDRVACRFPARCCGLAACLVLVWLERVACFEREACFERVACFEPVCGLRACRLPDCL